MVVCKALASLISLISLISGVPRYVGSWGHLMFSQFDCQLQLQFIDRLNIYPLSLFISQLRTSRCLIRMPSYFDLFVLSPIETNILERHWNIRTSFQFQTIQRNSRDKLRNFRKNINGTCWEVLVVPLEVWSSLTMKHDRNRQCD